MHPEAESTKAAKVSGVAGDDFSVAPNDGARRDEEVDVGDREPLVLESLSHACCKLGRFALEREEPEPFPEAVNPAELRGAVGGGSNSAEKLVENVGRDEEVASQVDEFIDCPNGCRLGPGELD